MNISINDTIELTVRPSSYVSIQFTNLTGIFAYITYSNLLYDAFDQTDFVLQNTTILYDNLTVDTFITNLD